MNIYRVEYKQPELHGDELRHTFIRAESMAAAKLKVAALPYAWKADRIERATEWDWQWWCKGNYGPVSAWKEARKKNGKL